MYQKIYIIGPVGSGKTTLAKKLAHKLNIKVVAEGIENNEQLDYLTKIKCDMIQGYFFEKPISITEFENKYLKA